MVCCRECGRAWLPPAGAAVLVMVSWASCRTHTAPPWAGGEGRGAIPGPPCGQGSRAGAEAGSPGLARCARLSPSAGPLPLPSVHGLGARDARPAPGPSVPTFPGPWTLGTVAASSAQGAEGTLPDFRGWSSEATTRERSWGWGPSVWTLAARGGLQLLSPASDPLPGSPASHTDANHRVCSLQLLNGEVICRREIFKKLPK